MVDILCSLFSNASLSKSKIVPKDYGAGLVVDCKFNPKLPPESGRNIDEIHRNFYIIICTAKKKKKCATTLDHIAQPTLQKLRSSKNFLQGMFLTSS